MLDLTQLEAYRPPIVETVASKGEGIEALWTAVSEHRAHQIEHGTLERMRRRRLELEFRQIVTARVGERIDAMAEADHFADINAAMVAGAIDPYQAADRLLAEVLRDRPGS
jgi:LAO/AO transport system kinase